MNWGVIMKREDVLEKLRNKQYIAILNSDEYKFLLTSIAQRITLQAKRAVNEATIENYFDCELFAFFKDVFEPLGYEYHPEKESQISTKRHISKGRADSAIGALVIEFKHYSKLANKTDRDSATSQISDYLLGLTFEENSISLGFVTDGINCCFVQQTAGEITVEAFEEISYKQLDRLVKNIILLELTALNSKNLVQDFCYTDSNSGIAYDIVNSLYAILANNIHPKTEMLFNEWKELFKLAHDDKSKQQAIINRRKSLEKIIGKKFNSLDEEYLSLYALQTSYAIIIKIVAF